VQLKCGRRRTRPGRRLRGRPAARGDEGTNVGAAISVVHDDGHARITMVGTPNNGELFAVTRHEVGVRSPPTNGRRFITVNPRTQGRGDLSNTHRGTVMVQDQHGNITGICVIPEE